MRPERLKIMSKILQLLKRTFSHYLCGIANSFILDFCRNPNFYNSFQILNFSKSELIMLFKKIRDQQHNVSFYECCTFSFTSAKSCFNSCSVIIESLSICSSIASSMHRLVFTCRFLALSLIQF